MTRPCRQLGLHNRPELRHHTLVLQTGRQASPVVVTGLVRRNVLEPIDEGLVQHSVGWNITVRSLVQGESDILPLVVDELPTSNQRE